MASRVRVPRCQSLWASEFWIQKQQGLATILVRSAKQEIRPGGTVLRRECVEVRLGVTGVYLVGIWNEV